LGFIKFKFSKDLKQEIGRKVSRDVSNLPIVGITMGDPSGVGPEIIAKVFNDPNTFECSRPLVLGDLNCLIRAAEIVKAEFRVEEVRGSEIRELDYEPGRANLLNLSKINLKNLHYGSPDKDCGKAMVDYVKEGVRLALNGEIDAIATAPISKKAIFNAGYHFPGHTELLADLTHTSEYAMMLMGERLKVVPVTIHCGLKEVPSLLKPEAILKAIKVTAEALREFFDIENPRIAVTALNPHAGEGGIFGSEEEERIIPAIKRAQEMGIMVSGPFPSDTLFYYAVQGSYDVVVCMYHDQALIPLKLLHFEDAINVTLGLPIIRTSVDHGTAYDLAGTGRANPNSLFNAVKWAAYMAKKKKRVD
jgi:4-hydroxythreonine-4-phosphate dehydrogenase